MRDIEKLPYDPEQKVLHKVDEVDIPSRDLVTHGRKGANVMDESVFDDYFDHHKGVHWREHDV